ncbi:MAG TPA: Eco57I restriction-modification methylase domain-containing protein [Candidatus Brocadiia bacterium]
MLDAPKQITELIERFGRNTESYHSQTYNETQLRREFIDPFFDALGWDITNKAGYAEAYKDVIHEDAIKVGGATKAPDYCFRIGGVRKFFLEAKKPSVGIKDDVSPAYQLRRYAWSAKLPLSILTDFEEFAVYDCRFPPKPDDKPSTCRILYLTYQEYASRWEEIDSVFSKDAVLRGSFDKFAVSGKGKRGTSEVDTEFLNEIEQWRDALARNLALRNPNLTIRDLNFAVQRTIDRIIFLRMCEDRGIAPREQLRALLSGDNTYERLRYIYGLADDRYNSGLFHFKPEKGRAEVPDELTLTLTVDDKALKDIIRRLYYPESPYEFSVLSADILGNVYEQFLGKVIRLTTGHHAVVEEKPEVKKAGGVYYTPAYIVDYIVKNTVGKLCEGKSPKQIAKLRILDPACGSGSFLIGAYQYLLDYHRDWYVKDVPSRHTKEIYQGMGRQWLLTTQEKKRILLNNIYGVDIDSQAVEVTKLSLLLKVLEGENKDTLERQFKMWRERALPDLGSNIKCGNSLIGPDFYANHQMNFLDEEQRYRINVFDWKAEFPQIIKAGGFDAVIGNPPYGAQFSNSEKNHLFIKYPLIKGQPESYEYFLFCALRLASKGGLVSFIVPTNFIESERAEGLRSILLESGHIQLLSSFRYNVWRKSAAETLVIVYQKGCAGGITRVVHPQSPNEFMNDVGAAEVNQPDWQMFSGKRFLIRGDAGLIRKIETDKLQLDALCDLTQGIIVYKTRKDSARNLYVSNKREGREWKKLLDTESSIGRYGLSWGKRYLKYGEWLWCPRDPKYFEQPKILFVRLRNKALPRKLIATYDEEGFYNRDNFNNIILKDTRYSLKFILGLFNSCLLNYWYKAYFDNVNINPAQVRLIPIRTINFTDKADKARHDRMVGLVEGMLGLHKRLKDAKTPDEKTRLQRQIDATDGQIDQLVYELYGLTEDEIRIVES